MLGNRSWYKFSSLDITYIRCVDTAMRQCTWKSAHFPLWPWKFTPHPLKQYIYTFDIISVFLNHFWLFFILTSSRSGNIYNTYRNLRRLAWSWNFFKNVSFLWKMRWFWVEFQVKSHRRHEKCAVFEVYCRTIMSTHHIYVTSDDENFTRIYSPTSKLLNGNKIMAKNSLVRCRHAKEWKNWPAGKATVKSEWVSVGMLIVNGT